MSKFPPSPHYSICIPCNGKGEVFKSILGRQLIPCKRCEGLGWVGGMYLPSPPRPDPHNEKYTKKKYTKNKAVRCVECAAFFLGRGNYKYCGDKCRAIARKRRVKASAVKRMESFLLKKWAKEDDVFYESGGSVLHSTNGAAGGKEMVR